MEICWSPTHGLDFTTNLATEIARLDETAFIWKLRSNLPAKTRSDLSELGAMTTEEESKPCQC